MQNPNIFLELGAGGRCWWSVSWLPSSRPPVAGGAGCRGIQDLQGVGSGPLVACSLPLVAFLLCSFGVAPEYGSIWLFKGVFSGFPLLDVCLYCWRALRGLCGFVRVNS